MSYTGKRNNADMKFYGKREVEPFCGKTWIVMLLK
jgi:hypothetical protein